MGSTEQELYGDYVNEAPGKALPWGPVGMVTVVQDPNTTKVCSGTLIARDVVALAAHCFCGPGGVPWPQAEAVARTSFSIPETTGPTPQPAVAAITAAPKGVAYWGYKALCAGGVAEAHAALDVACVQLSDIVPLSAVPEIMPIYTSGDFLLNNVAFQLPIGDAVIHPAWAVGYGGTSWDSQVGWGVRRAGPVGLYGVDIKDAYWLFTNDVDQTGGTTTAHIDSGGPLAMMPTVTDFTMIGISSLLGPKGEGPGDHIAWSPTWDDGYKNRGAFFRDNCLRDDDADGVSDTNDNCTPDKNAVCNLHVAACQNLDQADEDGDGVGDVCDSCPAQKNAGQQDSDGDGVGDVCDDCLYQYDKGQADGDADGVGDACDNCQQPNGYALCASEIDCQGGACLKGDDDIAGHCALQLDDADQDGVGGPCDLCPLHSAKFYPAANSNDVAEQRPPGAPAKLDICDPVPTFVSRPIVEMFNVPVPNVPPMLDPVGDGKGPRDVVMLSTAAAIGSVELPVHPVFPGQAGFRVCDCHDSNGTNLTKDQCLHSGCSPNPMAFDWPDGWKRVSVTAGWTDLGGFEPPTPNAPIYDLMLNVEFKGTLFFDHYDHPDPLEDEAMRVGDPGPGLIGWHWRHDTLWNGVPWYVDPNDGERKTAVLWWDHVPVAYVGGNPVYDQQLPTRDAATQGTLRDHYTYVTAPQYAVTVSKDLPAPFAPCPVPNCALVMRPGLDRINPDPSQQVVTFFDYLSGPARVVADGQALVAMQNPGDPIFDVTADLTPELQALVASGAHWLTPVESGRRVRQLGDRTHAVALPSPWQQASELVPIVAGPAGLQVAPRLGRDVSQPQSVATPRYLPSPRENARGLLTVTERSVFLVGGERPSGRPTGEIWRYDLDADDWQPLFWQQQIRPAAVLAVAYDYRNGRLYVIDELEKKKHVPGGSFRLAAGADAVEDLAEPEEEGDEPEPHGEGSHGGHHGPAEPHEPKKRARLLLFDTRSGQVHVLRTCPRSSKVARIALVARDDGTVLQIAWRAKHDDWTAWRLELQAPSTVAYSGKLSGDGSYLDEPVNTGRAVVVPLVQGGEHRMLAITDAMLGQGAAGCNAF